jgi:hypothetical protein
LIDVAVANRRQEFIDCAGFIDSAGLAGGAVFNYGNQFVDGAGFIVGCGLIVVAVFNHRH